MKISICVPWRSSDPKRIGAWEYCRDRWRSSPFELSVASDGGEPGEPFSRAKAINEAVRKSAGDVVVIFGADGWTDVVTVHAAALRALHEDWSPVTAKVICYTEEQAAGLYGRSRTPLEFSDLARGTYQAPGIIAVRRSAWDSIGGMDERFGSGYGFEDCALRNRLAYEYGSKFIDTGTLYVLPHDHAGELDPVNKELFYREYAQLAPDMN